MAKAYSRRVSRAGADSKPQPQREERPSRFCLHCRGKFRAETRFFFMCVRCRRATGGIDAR